MAKRTKKRSSRRKLTIPLAIVGGLTPVVVGVYNRRSSGAEMAAYLQKGFTGVDPSTGSFNLANLRLGMVPVLSGVLVHKLAGMLGVNRAIGRTGLPFIRI